MDGKQLLKNAQNILKKEGATVTEVDNETTLKTYILPAMQSSKDILSTIYGFNSRNREGFLGKIKTKIQQKIIFTVINVIEKQSMRQQKFNELTYKAIEKLVEENENLKKEIESLKK
jgi:hypothetical protein